MLIFRSPAQTPEKHPDKSNAYDGIASGSPLAAAAAEGGARVLRGLRVDGAVADGYGDAWRTPPPNTTGGCACGVRDRNVPKILS